MAGNLKNHNHSIEWPDDNSGQFVPLLSLNNMAYVLIFTQLIN